MVSASGSVSRVHRVLHVLAPARYGGLERVVTSLAKGQTEAGLEVHVLAIMEPGQTDHPFLETALQAGVRLDVLALPPRRYLAERRAVLERCQAHGPSVVHLHGARPDVLQGAAIRQVRLPVVSTVHGFTGGDLKNRVYEALQRRALRRFDAVVAVSRQMAVVLVDAGVPAARIHTIPNAPPPSGPRLSRGDARSVLGLAADERVLGWVGRMTREKGCDLFLDAVSRLNRPEVAVSVIGSGNEGPALARAAGNTGLLARIKWHGEIASAGQLLEAFDLLVISSRSEGTPILLFEAIQAGVPVVTTAVGGIPDVVSNDEAYLVQTATAADLADGILRALSDPGAAAGRASRARERIAKEFSRSRWIDLHSAVYDAVVTNLNASQSGLSGVPPSNARRPLF